MKMISSPTLYKLIMSAITIVLTSACVSLLPESELPAPRYTMNAVTPTNAPALSVDWSLVVDDPTSSQLYNSVKIAITRETNRYEFYAGTEWTDRAPALFHRALIQSFENSDRILNVGDFTDQTSSDYILKTDIRKLHVDNTGSSTIVVVNIYAKLLNQSGQIIAVRNFNQQTQTRTTDIATVMSGFDQVMTTTLNDIVNWGFQQSNATYGLEKSSNS